MLNHPKEKKIVLLILCQEDYLMISGIVAEYSVFEYSVFRIFSHFLLKVH